MTYGGPPGPPWPPAPRNGMGTASMVLGIVGLVLSLTIVFGIVCGVLAVIFGASDAGGSTAARQRTAGQQSPAS